MAPEWIASARGCFYGMTPATTRADLARAVGLDEQALPFAGELLQVDHAAAAWEGAIERLLRARR